MDKKKLKLCPKHKGLKTFIERYQEYSPTPLDLACLDCKKMNVKEIQNPADIKA